MRWAVLYGLQNRLTQLAKVLTLDIVQLREQDQLDQALGELVASEPQATIIMSDCLCSITPRISRWEQTADSTVYSYVLAVNGFGG
jgi:hypothetical protein